MKGYNTELKKFINYVFTKYGNDSEVCNFRNVYAENQKVLSEKPKNKERKYIRISIPCAELCKKLVEVELERGKILSAYTKAFSGKLKNAESEFKNAKSGDFETIDELLERLRNEH